jgi:hypothetical protein
MRSSTVKCSPEIILCNQQYYLVAVVIIISSNSPFSSFLTSLFYVMKVELINRYQSTELTIV